MTQTPMRRLRRSTPPDSLRCLIVDDEPRLRQVLVHLMQSDGFTCVEAGNGEEALALLADSIRCTLVLSDLRMPKMDGLELLRAGARSAGPTPRW